jgi:hypothetical protein
MDSAAGEAYREQRRRTAALDHPGDAAAVRASAGGVGGPSLVVYLPVSGRAERLGVLAVSPARSWPGSGGGGSSTMSSGSWGMR